MTAVSGNRNGGSGGDARGLRTHQPVVRLRGRSTPSWTRTATAGASPIRAAASASASCRRLYSLKPGDCNDYDKNANPMGREICNLYDDDCDGMINEGLDTETVYRDMDRDGHGGRFGDGADGLRHRAASASRPRATTATTPTRRSSRRRWRSATGGTTTATTGSTTARGPPAASAGAGGWRPAARPTPASPGPPRAEVCNAFDDDCDDVIDNGDNLCMGGMVCHKGLCLTKEEAAEAEARDPTPPPPDGGAAAGGSGGSGGGSRRRGAAAAAWIRGEPGPGRQRHAAGGRGRQQTPSWAAGTATCQTVSRRVCRSGSLLAGDRAAIGWAQNDRNGRDPLAPAETVRCVKLAR